MLISSQILNSVTKACSYTAYSGGSQVIQTSTIHPSLPPSPPPQSINQSLNSFKIPPLARSERELAVLARGQRIWCRYQSLEENWLIRWFLIILRIFDWFYLMILQITLYRLNTVLIIPICHQILFPFDALFSSSIKSLLQHVWVNYLIKRQINCYQLIRLLNLILSTMLYMYINKIHIYIVCLFSVQHLAGLEFHWRNVLDATDAGKTPVSLMTDDDHLGYFV